MRRGERLERPRQRAASQVGGVVTTVIVVALVVVAGLAAFWWFVVRSDADPPPELSTSPTVAGGTIDGTWEIRRRDQFGSFVQYRVTEQYAGAVVESDATGRTSRIRATMRIDGTTVVDARVEVDMQSLESDRLRRDEAMQTQGLQTDMIPAASFVLTEPIDLGATPAKGKPIEVSATGDLTLHAVTRRVTIPLEGRWDGEAVEVVGRLPIEFADYRITPPSVGGFVTVADKGRMELKLIFLKTP